MKIVEIEYDDERLVAWNEKHLREEHGGVEPYGGAIGGRISFIVTPTSIGQLVSVRCCLCETKDYDISGDL